MTTPGNLSDAFSSLENYLCEFRKLFEKRIDDELLTELEKEELNTIESLMLTRIYFVYYPRTALGNAKRQIPLRIRQQYQRKLDEIKAFLEIISDDSTKAKIVDIDSKWKNEATLWIQLDVQSPLDIYPKFEILINNRKKTIGTIQYGDPEYLGNEMYYKRIAIIPTVKDKFVENKVKRPAFISCNFRLNKDRKEI